MRARAFRGGGGPAGRRDQDVQAAAPAPDPWVSPPAADRVHRGTRAGLGPAHRIEPVGQQRVPGPHRGCRGGKAAHRKRQPRPSSGECPSGDAATFLAWDAVADVTGAPVVVPDVIDPHSSRDAARLVDDAGGAVAVSRRWAHDPADQAVAALFTPFGRLDTDEQRAVIRTIHRSGGYGDQVWVAALRSATYRPQRSTG